MSLEPNPYASPLTTDLDAPPLAAAMADVELIRRNHLTHEASVRSIGVLYYLGGVLLVLAAIGMGSALTWGPGLGPAAVVVLLCYLALGWGMLAVGRGLRRLQSWTRIPVGILSGLGLLQFPVGTLINAYILYLVFSAKGAMVLSPEYREIMRQTPHMKYRSSLLTLVLLAILIVIIVGGILWALLLG